MPRHGNGDHRHHTTRQKGRRGQRGRLSTYARLNKGRKADHYDRPYIDGSYARTELDVWMPLGSPVRR